VNLPSTPQAWAIHLSRLVKIFHDAHGLDPFPIKVAPLAMEYSRQVFPDAPITLVDGIDLSSRFDGMLMPSPHVAGEWGIVYNKAIRSPGRVNFTLAHELGHYLLHRHMSPAGIQCSSRSMLDWRSELGAVEAQANTFASFLLMPLDDFRNQIRGEDISLDLMRHLANRYEVSITAAILKWLGITERRAMLVIGSNGFIDWARSSDRLMRSGIFYRARQQTIPLPEQSLAAQQGSIVGAFAKINHPHGVWLGDEDVHEMTIFSHSNEITISLLIYPDDAPGKRWANELDEPKEWDTYDQFVAGNHSSAR
jgi:IrrE N-terminal-like domain